MLNPISIARAEAGHTLCWAACYLLLFVFATATGLAQQGKDLSQASLEELAKIQVYSASKHLQSVSEAPSSVTIITADEIQKYGYRTLADILRSLRGFYVTYDRNYSFVGVRGFEYLGDWDSRILLLVDGHRINNNVSNMAMFGTEFPVDVDLIQRVEIIRGPTSSLYGSDAFLAVINVVTRRPSQLKHFEFSFAPASFGTYEERASYGGQYRGVGMTLSSTFYNSAGQTLFFPEFNSPATNYGITRKTDDENSQHALATISFRDFTLQGMFSYRDKGNPTAYFGTVFDDPRTRNFDDQQYVDLRYEHALAENWTITVRTSYDQYRLQSPLAVASASPGGPVSMDTFSERGNWWTSEVKLNRRLLGKHNLTFGSEVRDNLRQDEGDFTSATGQFDQELNSSWIGALYAQAELALTGRLGLSAGVRYDHYSTFGGTTNPRLGLIYHPFERTTLKALYGSAFNAPASVDTTPDYGSFYENNLQLRPETIHSAEGVVEQNLGGHFTASGSVFDNKIDRLISLEPDPTNGLFVYRNIGKADAAGMEAELDGRFAGGLEGTASYSYANAQDLIDHAVLEDSPHHLGKLNLVLPLVPARLFASLEAQYMSARQTLAGNTVGAFAVFNGTLLVRNLGKHLDLSASLYNILDKRYFDPGRAEDVEDAIQQDGRSFRLKLTARF
jgi:iron complex outermembrane receptor protein